MVGFIFWLRDFFFFLLFIIVVFLDLVQNKVKIKMSFVRYFCFENDLNLKWSLFLGNELLNNFLFQFLCGYYKLKSYGIFCIGIYYEMFV